MLLRMEKGWDNLSTKLKAWARGLKREVATLWFALRDPETPWYAKAIGVVVIGYAMSPIDLIPDFIPVLGYLDDVILLPLGLALFRKLVPKTVFERARSRAEAEIGERRPTSKVAGAFVILLWLVAAGLIIGAILGAIGRGKP